MPACVLLRLSVIGCMTAKLLPSMFNMIFEVSRSVRDNTYGKEDQGTTATICRSNQDKGSLWSHDQSGMYPLQCTEKLMALRQK